MHVKSGEKLLLAVIGQNVDGQAYEGSYTVELWKINVPTGVMEEVTPVLIAGAEGNITGTHYYEYTTPESGHFVYDWRYYTADETVLAMEIREQHESGGSPDQLDLAVKLLRTSYRKVAPNTIELYDTGVDVTNITTETPIETWELFDSNGDPTLTNIYYFNRTTS